MHFLLDWLCAGQEEGLISGSVPILAGCVFLDMYLKISIELVFVICIIE